MNAPLKLPQGPVVALGVPDVQDYPRLVFSAPYFVPVAIADLIDPSVQESVEGMLPTLLPPLVDDAAQNAVNQYAVLLTGSVMTGPLLLWGDPTTPTMAATKNYVDAMLSTAGIPEVPPVPIGQLWARETGQWVPIDASGGNFLPLTGGTLAGPINMSGNQITGLPAVPTQPDGAASSGWVLQQLAAVSLYQGVWNPATNVPDLTLPVSHQNAYTWIANPVATGGVVVTAAIPGLQGVTVYEGDTIIFSAQSGTFTAIHAGGLTVTEADARYLQLAGGQMTGALLLNSNPTQPMQAANMSWVQSLLSGAGIPEAPGDGQNYLRNGSSDSWVPGIAVSGGVMTGALMLNAAATSNLQAVPYGQISAVIPPAANPNTVWAGPLSAPAAAPAWRTLSAADIGGGVLPVIRGGTGQVTFTNGLVNITGNVFNTVGFPGTGVVMSNGSALSGVSPLPVANGGTGVGAFASNGLLQVTGAPGAPAIGVSSTPIPAVASGTFPVTDQSGAGLGTLGTGYYYVVGNLVWALFDGTYPSNSSSANAVVGGLPYSPITGGLPCFMRCNPGGYSVAAHMGANGTCALFNVSSAANQENSGMATVSFSFWAMFQHS